MEISFKSTGLRSIRSMPYVHLLPVTILVGLNNSGKSTFLRALPLIKQTIESKYDVPILWNGDLVDFENFETAINQSYGKKQENMSFSFKFNNMHLSYYNILNFEILHDMFLEERNNVNIPKNIIYTVTIKDSTKMNNKNSNIFKKLSIEYNNLNTKYDLFYSNNGDCIEKFLIDGIDLHEILEYDNMRIHNNSIFFDDDISLDKFINGRKYIFNLFNTLRSMEIDRILSEKVRGSVSVDEILVKFQELFIEMQSNLSEIIYMRDDKYYKNIKLVQKIYNKLNKIEKNILNLITKLYLFTKIIKNMESDVSDFVYYLNYLTPVRAGVDRYHRTQDVEIFDIDSVGKNLPLFLNSLSKEQFQAFSNWVCKHYKYRLDISDKNGHFVLNAEFNGQKFNIADTGFGITQILPVLAQIWWAKNKPFDPTPFKDRGFGTNAVPRTLLMEQPELHLHPRQQANLANAIADIVESEESSYFENPRFIIETHSEKLLGRFSRLIFNKKIKHTKVQVIKFSSTDLLNPVVTKVKVCKFTKDGKLTNWECGFFNSWEEE